MNPDRIRRTATLLAGVALFGAVSPVRAAEEPALPPYNPAYRPTDAEERGLWMLSDDYERELRRSPLLVEDAELKAYVRRVLCNTVGGERCRDVRIYILELPEFNATMTPNGALQVYTGLLLRVRSEAELGAILGHEFAHFELRHGLAGYRKARDTGNIMALIGVVAEGIGLGGVGDLVQISMLGSTFSYQREQEREADLLGLAFLGASDYPSSAAAEVWANLMAEEDAAYAARRGKKNRHYKAGFFASHPTSLARRAYLAEQAAAIGDGGDPHVVGHHAAIDRHLPQWLEAQGKLNDFGGTDHILHSIADIQGWTPQLLFARGRMYQSRADTPDLVSAVQFYREALASGYRGAEAHRNLGLALLRSGAAAEAAPELREYLRLMPDALDYGAISALVPGE